MLKLCSALILIMLGMLLNSLPLSASYGERDLPALHITSKLNPFLQEREFWHNGMLSLVSENPEYNFEDEVIRIRGRGNTTWWQAPTKRSLRIRFENPHAMFGLGAHQDWILLANAFDASLLRTHLTFYFASHLGDTTNFVPRTQFVHLYINGRYAGVYQLTDERDNGPDRGDVSVHYNPEISEYWLEMDMRTTDYFNINGLYYDFRMPSGSELTEAHIGYVYRFLSEVSEAIRARDWDKINSLVCIDSFVDFYIVQEWSKELDIFFSSVFMQILGQGEDRRLVLGPFWDFDNSFGSNNFAQWGITTEPIGELWAQHHYWFYNLMRIQKFRNLVAERWNETSDAREASINNLEYIIKTYRSAFERNFTAVPMYRYSLTISRSPRVREIGSNWVRQVEYLIIFASLRASWLDDYFIYSSPTRFSDVHPLNWFYGFVMEIYETGVLTGHVGNVFSPNIPVNRGEFQYVLSVLSYGFANCYIDEPYASLTRKEMAVLLYNMAIDMDIQIICNGEDVFDDIGNLPPYTRRAINTLRSEGIISGRQNNEFDPYGTVTRAEAATAVVRFITIINNKLLGY